jgi:hypothetical protein
MRIQCGVPGIVTSAMWEAQAPKKLPRSTKPLTQRKATWKGTTLQIIGCERTPGRDFLGDQLLANGDNNAPDHRRIPCKRLTNYTVAASLDFPGNSGRPKRWDASSRRSVVRFSLKLNGNIGTGGTAILHANALTGRSTTSDIRAPDRLTRNLASHMLMA